MPRTRRLWIALIALSAVIAAAGATACADRSTANPERRDSSPPSTGTPEPPAPENFTGTDDQFYVVPDPLPPGEPGELIRVQPLGEAAGRASSRIMYHSRDAQGDDRAVTGVLTYPTSSPPDDGWPVISTAHGTSGMASQCAPSRTQDEAPDWGVPGVWVMSDYIGLGPVGELHPYLSRSAEGNAVIDAVRAARQVPDANAGSRWLVIGHSQGGHGALAAAELASDYAPELELLGTVALAPGAMFDRVYGGVDPIATTILTMMGLYGAAAEHPDIDVTDYVTPEGDAASEVFRTGCLEEITTELIPVAIAGPFSADPRQTEPARSVILANDVGNVAADVPLLLTSGTADSIVVIDRVRDLYDRLCTNGQVTELLVVEGADHDSILPETSDEVTAFLDQRLAGGDPVDTCLDR